VNNIKNQFMKNENDTSSSPGQKDTPAQATKPGHRGVSNNAETVICGLDGRVIVTFAEPAPSESAEVTAQGDKRPSWLRTLRRDGKPRWQTNRRSAR